MGALNVQQMSTAIRFVKVAGIILGATAIIATAIFPFTAETGIHGYLTVHGWCCIGVTIIGSLFVYGSRGSHRIANGMDMAGFLDNDVAQEIRRDGHRGKNLGMELFYAGLICTIVIFYLRSGI